MNYAVVHMDWSAGVHGKKIQYCVSEIAAVSLDETLHTIDTFRFILDQSNGYVRSEKHFDGGKVIFAEQEEGFKRFQKWYKGHDCLVVWSKDVKDLLLHFCPACDIKYKKRLKTVCVQRLFESMTMNISIVKESGKLSFVMEMLGLKCEADRIQEPLYYVQALVRLFRKLCTSGSREMGASFYHGLMAEDYFYITRHAYFPQIEEKLRRERNRRIREMIAQAGCTGNVTADNMVSVETDTSSWKFDISEPSPVLRYTTHIFYRGVRTRYTLFDKGVGWEEKIQEILCIIKDTDKMFRRGVGNSEITDLLEQIAQRISRQRKEL